MNKNSEKDKTVKELVSEARILKEFDISRTMLNRYRTGFTVGRYAYVPKLIEGVDWMRIGAKIFYCKSGVDFIHQRCDKTLKRQQKQREKREKRET